MAGVDAKAAGELIGRIDRALSENGFGSVAPILEVLKVGHVDSAVKELQPFLDFFGPTNFHPILAHVTRILMILERERGDVKVFVEYAFRCISPVYSRFLPRETQEWIVKAMAEVGPVAIEISSAEQSPFDVSVGLLNMATSPSDDVSVVVAGRVLTQQSVVVDSVSVVVEHSQDGNLVFEVMKDVEFPCGKRTKSVQTIPVHRPGTIRVTGLVLKVKNIECTLRAFRPLGYNTASILPYDTECNFTITKSDFGITKVPYTVKMTCDSIPNGADSLTFSLKFNSDPEVVKLLDCSDTNNYTETIEHPPKLVEREIRIQAQRNCDLKVEVVWSVLCETVNSSHTQHFNVKFSDPFTVDFKLFDPERAPVSLKQPPLVLHDEKYILVTTFEYNLPVASTVVGLESTASDGLELNRVQFDLPLDVTTSEAFTTACFLTALASAKSGSLGRYELQYQVNGASDTLRYIAEMPSAIISSKKVNIDVVKPADAILNKESQLQINVQCVCEEGIEGAFVIDSCENFVIKGEARRPVTLAKDEKIDVSIAFVPVKHGYQEFPRLSFVDASSMILWKSVLSFVVKKE